MLTDRIVELLESALATDGVRDRRREILRSACRSARDSSPRVGSPGPGVAASAAKTVIAAALTAAWVLAIAPEARFSSEVRQAVREAAWIAVRMISEIDPQASYGIVNRRHVPGGDWTVLVGEFSVGAAATRDAAEAGARAFAQFVHVGSVEPVVRRAPGLRPPRQIPEGPGL